MDNYERHINQTADDCIDVECPKCSMPYRLTYGGWVAWMCECGTEIPHPGLSRYTVTASVKVYMEIEVDGFDIFHARNEAEAALAQMESEGEAVGLTTAAKIAGLKVERICSTYIETVQ